MGLKFIEHWIVKLRFILVNGHNGVSFYNMYLYVYSCSLLFFVGSSKCNTKLLTLSQKRQEINLTKYNTDSSVGKLR
jgi:hypothetical protein